MRKNKAEMNETMLEQVNGGDLVDAAIAVTSKVSSTVVGTDFMTDDVKSMLKTTGKDMLNEMMDGISSSISSALDDCKNSIIRNVYAWKIMLFD